jgi:hypothetical protein
LTSMSRSKFNRKLKNLDFLVLTAIFALSLLGIVITGRKWCLNIKRLQDGHHVTFKFGDGIFCYFRIFRRFHVLASNWRFYSHSPGGVYIELQY